MKREWLIRDIRQVDRLLERGADNIALQKQIVTDLAEWGHAAMAIEARRLLVTFQTLHKQHTDHRERLLRELAMIEANGMLLAAHQEGKQPEAAASAEGAAGFGAGGSLIREPAIHSDMRALTAPSAPLPSIHVWPRSTYRRLFGDQDQPVSGRHRWRIREALERAADLASAGAAIERRSEDPRANALGVNPELGEGQQDRIFDFNARADGVDTKPAFRGAWKAGRRCLIITDGFYEWRKSDKQPFAIAMGNRGLMTMAGLWEAWKPKEAEDWTLSCTIITTDANPLLAEVHDRMPVILGHEDWPKWLGEEPATADELKAMLKPFDASRMAIWPVDKKVGNVKNEGPEPAEKIAA